MTRFRPLRLGVALSLALIAGVPSTCALASDDDVIVGVLEHLSPGQKQRLDGAYGNVGTAVIRVAFRKEAGQWQAFKSDFGDVDQLQAATQSFPQKLEWTVAVDGRERGHLAGATPPQWKVYGDVGVQLIPSGQNVIRIGKPNAGFERWDTDQPVYRPLVVVSRPNTRDPEQWRPAKLDKVVLAHGIASFRAQLATEAAELRFRDRDVRVVKAYRSKTGPMMFGLILNKKLSGVDGPPGPEWAPRWFVADTAQSIRFLGAGLTLVDAGDYDNDGRSEVVFAKSGYDYDGYVLFYDDFRQSAEFGWTYH